MLYIRRFSPAMAALALLLTGACAWAAPQAGDRSLTLSGTGTSDNGFDNNNFGVSGELGYFMNDRMEVGVRQSVTAADRENADNIWAGATRGFADWHFGGTNALQPFVGASLGGIYGDGVKETWAAGPEVGIKYYVKDKTFIQLQAEYQFLFQNASDVNNQFDDGAYFYTVGIGYNF